MVVSWRRAASGGQSGIRKVNRSRAKKSGRTARRLHFRNQGFESRNAQLDVAALPQNFSVRKMDCHNVG